MRISHFVVFSVVFNVEEGMVQVTPMRRLSVLCVSLSAVTWYGDGAGNAVEENSSVVSLIRMR